MAAKKYLNIVLGKITQLAAVVVSAGAANDGDLVALDATGRLDNSVMPVGIGSDTASIQASEGLAAGDFVNIHDDTGSSRVRKADAAMAGKEAMGFVLAGAAGGANAVVYFEGQNTQLTGLTPGVRYYLSTTTPGLVTAAPPSGAGNVVQYLGTAISATTLAFEATDGVVLT